MEFIRFGEIPKDERSAIFKGSGDGKYLYGYEIGVSCYHASKIDGKYHIVLPHITKTTLNTLHSLYYCFERDKCFLVSGDLVGYGTDGEPLIRNVKILQTINLISYE